MTSGAGEWRIGVGRQQDEAAVRAEQGAQRDRGLAGDEPAEEIETRVHREAHRAARQRDVDGGASPVHRQGPLGRSTLCVVDDERHLQREGGAVLRLAQLAAQPVAVAVDAHADVAQGQARGAGAVGPLAEEAVQVAVARRREGVAQVGEARDAEAVVGVETAQPGDEGRIAQFAAQHVEHHHRLAVADRLGGRAVAAAKGADREVARGVDIVHVGLQGVAAVVCTLTLALAQQVVGEVGREALAPVAARVVDVDAVSPPIVEDLVRIGGVQDEGQADDLRAEQRERRHAVAALPEILDQGELGVGIGADQAVVEGEIVGRGREVALGQGRVGRAQVDLGLGHRCRAGVAGEGRGDQVDLVLRVSFVPGDAHPVGGLGDLRAGTLRDRQPAAR
ncbi:hypothetical protein CKO22_10580 [Thiococcus pfennigii]|nr:hypothetical protein [Thiococcus pfennigii]